MAYLLTEYHTIMKMNKFLLTTRTEMDLKNIRLNAESQTQKRMYCKNDPFMWSSENRLWWLRSGRVPSGDSDYAEGSGSAGISCSVFSLWKLIDTRGRQAQGSQVSREERGCNTRSKVFLKWWKNLLCHIIWTHL